MGTVLLLIFSAAILIARASCQDALTYEVIIDTPEVDSDETQYMNLTFFYDADDENSRSYFLYSLVPLWNALQDFVKFDLKPVAKNISNTDGQWVRECIKEGNDCADNLYHACVMQSEANDTDKFYFVECFMESEMIDTSLNECAEKNNIPLDEVTECASTETSDEYLSENTQEALTFMSSTDVAPIIVINNVLTDNEGVLPIICNSTDIHLPSNCNEILQE